MRTSCIALLSLLTLTAHAIPPTTFPNTVEAGALRSSGGFVSVADPSRVSVVTADGRYNAFPGLAYQNGTLYLVYRKGAVHVGGGDRGAIVLRYSSNLGATWSAETVLLSSETLDYRDPSLAVLADGSLALTYFTYDPSVNRPQSAYFCTSTDGGVTWSLPVSLRGEGYWNAVTAPVVQMANGDLLAATYGRTDASDPYDDSVIVRSTDGGATWATGATLATDTARSLDEPTLLPLPDGSLLASLRDYTNNVLLTAKSTDGGATWGPLTPQFPAQSRGSLLRFTDGTLMVLYRGKLRQGFINSPFNVRFSTDNGATWTPDAQERMGDVDKTRLFYDYASSVEIAPGVAACVYALYPNANSADLRLRFFTAGGDYGPSATRYLQGLQVRDDVFLSDTSRIILFGSPSEYGLLTKNSVGMKTTDGTGQGDFTVFTSGGDSTHGRIVFKLGQIVQGWFSPSGLTLSGGVTAPRQSTPNAAGSPLAVSAGAASPGSANRAGGTLYLSSGVSTGNGRSSVVVQTPAASVNGGTADNALADRLIVTSEKTLQNNVANGLFEVDLTSTAGAGGVLTYAIRVTDGSAVQEVAGTVTFAAVNRAGIYTTQITAANVPAACSSGTLNPVWTVTPGANKITVQVDPGSSLAVTQAQVSFTLNNHSSRAVVLL